jgi:HK97 family phage portal protein
VEIAARIAAASRALFGKREERGTLKDGKDLLELIGTTASSKNVNETSAMTMSAVYACVRILSENVASLPLRVRRKTAKGSEDADDHPLNRVLKDDPNDSETSFEWLERMHAAHEMRGNCYGLVKRNAYFEPEGIEYVGANEVEVVRVGRGRGYKLGGKLMQPGEILHVPSMSLDGLTGLSVLKQAKEGIGVALAAQEFGARFFGNNARPGGVIEFPVSTTEEQAKAFLKDWRKKHEGPAAYGKVAGLVGGIKYQNIGISNEDAEFLATRQFQIEDIARFYGVPLFLLQSTEKSTSWGSGMEQIQLAFQVFTLRPRLVRWERRMNSTLISERDRAAGYYVSFNLNAILRGAFADRMAGYVAGLTNGIYSINDVRRLEDLPELPDNVGGIHRVPLNIGPADAPANEKVTA